MSDRVLVTGATGFVGSHLVEALLEKGDHVACLVRPTSDTSTLPVDNLELRLGDVTDLNSLESAVKDTDVVYHVAGAIEARSLAELNAVNELGTRNLGHACARLGTSPVLVLVSSLEAAGPDPEGPVRTEVDPSVPVSNYGKSKLASEHAIQEFVSAVPTSIVRAAAVFGERDRETLAVVKALQVAGLNLYTVPRAHSTNLSLIHARDLAHLLILTAEDGERVQPSTETNGQGLYYAADEEILTLAEIVGRIANAIGGRQPTIINLPVGFAWLIGGGFEAWSRIRGRSPGVLSLDKIRSFAAGSFTCSPDKAHSQLGFAPARPLDERLIQTMGWYQAQGWL